MQRKATQTKSAPDVIEEFSSTLEGYVPSLRRKALRILTQLLPDFEAQYNEQPCEPIDFGVIVATLQGSPDYRENMQYALKLLAEKLTYHKPVFQREILAALIARLPEVEKQYEEDTARDALIDDLLNDVISDMSTSRLVLLVKQLKETG